MVSFRLTRRPFPPSVGLFESRPRRNIIEKKYYLQTNAEQLLQALKGTRDLTSAATSKLLSSLW